MPRYRYRARQLNGRLVQAAAEAASEDELARDLEPQGLTLIEARSAERAAKPVGRNRKLSPADLIFLTMELGTSYRAGLPLMATLDDMAASSDSRAIREVIRGVAERVRGGAPLGAAFEAYPKAFPPLYVELVRAAERTGKLDVILADLVKFLEWQKQVKGQIASATVYPASLFGAVIVLVLVLLIFVFPKFLASFASMGDSLPMPTKVLLWVDKSFKAHGPVAVAALVVIVVGLVLLSRIPAVRWKMDLFKLRNPIIGPLLTKVLMSRFTHNLGMMLSSGLEFGQSLEICERLMGNAVLTQLVIDARKSVEEGKPLSDAISEGGHVPSLVRRMLKLGESTGRMEEALENVSEFYDREVPVAIKRMFGIVEPLLLAFMAGVVLFMASAVMLPLYSMLDRVGTN
jgi:type IV pilus assembly protein PilC